MARLFSPATQQMEWTATSRGREGVGRKNQVDADLRRSTTALALFKKAQFITMLRAKTLNSYCHLTAAI